MKSQVEEYLAVRRAVGFKLEATAHRLRSFARYAEARGENHVQAATAMAWASTASSPCQTKMAQF